MQYDRTDRDRPTDAGNGEPTSRQFVPHLAGGDQTLEDDVAAALSFFKWAENENDQTPLSDAHAEYALRMSAGLEVPAQRLERMCERVFAPQAAEGSSTHSLRPDAPISAAPGATGAVASTPVRDSAPTGTWPKAGSSGALSRHPEHLSLVPNASGPTPGPRPNFGRRCREMKRKIGEVARELRVNDEVLLALEQGHAHSVPRAFLAAAAAFVDYDAPTLARCFAPNSGDVARMAAHDRSGQAPSTAPSSADFLSIVEESELSEADKQYWRAVVEAEGASDA